MKGRTFFFGKLILTTSILVYIFYKYVNWPVLKIQILLCDWAWILPLICVNFLIRYVTARQMRIAFIPYQISAPTWQIMKTQFISTFYSLILPGDFAAGGITWHLLSKEHGQRIHIGSVVIFMRLISIVALIPFAILGTILEPKLIEMQTPQLVGISSLIFFLLCLPFFSRHTATLAQTLLEMLLSRIPWKKMTALHSKVWDSINTCNQMSFRFKSKLMAYAVFIQFLSVVGFWIASLVVKIDLPWTTAFWYLSVLTMVQVLPLTIAGLGLREFSMVFLFNSLYGIPSELSILLSSLIFISMILFSTLPGAYFILKHR